MQFKLAVAQPKNVESAQSAKQPVAPPVYRPQPAPKVLQTKSSSAQSPQATQSPRRPVAPPVYRPEAKKTLQPKAASQLRKPPAAPPAYRPEQTRVAQPKLVSATPERALPKAHTVSSPQARPAGSQAKSAGLLQLKHHPVAAQKFRPQPLPKVLQTKKGGSEQAGNQQRTQTGVRPPIKGCPASGGVVQRLIYLSKDQDNFISTDCDTKRPTGCVSGGSQGDHSTPFTSLQNQIMNAIEGVTLDDAWENLEDTFKVYKTLPGWDESTTWLTGTAAPYVEKLLKAKGDLNALQAAVTEMLALRNQIALSSYPKGGSGNGEGKWAGSLQYQERQFQLGHNPILSKTEVLDYIWKAFEHGRFNNLKSDDRKDMIIRQHAITMADAYPLLTKSVGIDKDDIVAHYPKHNWLSYSPK